MTSQIASLPQICPNDGIVIIGFTTEQVKTYNIRLFDKKEIVIVDRFNPDQHSIEEAVIITTHPAQMKLKPGDGVLVDYCIFSGGRHPEIGSADVSRFIGRHEDYYLYWCYDDMHPANSSEIFALIDEEGKLKAHGDAVIVYPHEEQEVLIEVLNSIGDFHYVPGADWALVYASPVEEISAGDLILCEKGLSPTIKYRGIEMQYINLPYILGKADINSPMRIKLF